MLRLLDELGVDPNNFEWQDLAACKNLDTELLFDKYEKDTFIASNITEVCYTCPVLKACFEAGRDGKEWGLWGGVYRVHHGRLDLSKNNKTEEEWQLLEKRLGYDPRT